MKTFALILFTCGLAPILQAQQPVQPTPRPVPPPGPWLEKAPDYARWTVTTKGSSAPLIPPPGASPSPTPTPAARQGKPTEEPPDSQTVVVKTKPLRYEQTVIGTQRKIVKWFLPDMQITSEGAEAPVVVLHGTNSIPNNGKSDFPGFEWIAPQNFEGILKFSGQDCLVFKDAYKVEGKVVKGGDKPLMSTACIGLDSRMPVALQLGDEVRTYQFVAAPTTALTPPPEIEAVAAQWRKVTRQAALPVAKP